jgi:cytochrome c-type biogenesis protein CcmH
MKKIVLITFLLFHTSSLVAENKLELLEITKNLRCLVCQGQSIADSNSDFASTIKLVVKDQLSRGKNKEEIYEFLILKYGEWIVYKPSLTKENLFLWLLPYGVFLFGGFIIFVILKKKKNS